VGEVPGSCHRHHRVPRVVFVGKTPNSRQDVARTRELFFSRFPFPTQARSAGCVLRGEYPQINEIQLL
jgi:hypothetical protein